MKARFCLSTDVCQCDDFQSLSLESQVLYYNLCASADSAGKVTSPRREARAYGLDADPAWLNDLYVRGYLLDVDGVTYIRHHWINNTFQVRVFTRSVESLPQYISGILGFEGEIGKSAYTITRSNDDRTSLEPRSNDDRTSLEPRRKERNGRDGNVIDGNVIEPNSIERELIRHTERKKCQCPDCGATAYYTQDEYKNTTIVCNSCGAVNTMPRY